MKVAVFSDTHDNFQLIEKAIEKAKKEKAEVLIHCGDVCSPAALFHISDLWEGDIHYSFGNVDGDKFTMLQKGKEDPSIHFYSEDLGSLELGGKRIAFQHYPEISLRLAESGAYDAVFYGHDHKRYQEYIGETLLANPGNLCGIKHPPSFGIYNTETNKIKHIDMG